MEIKDLHKNPNIEHHKKLNTIFGDLEKLIYELRKRKIPSQIVISINQYIDDINSFPKSNKKILKQLKKTRSDILKLIEKELKLVPKNHYRNMWMAIGIGTFGIPIGIAFGASLGNTAFIGVGIPIGMAIGIGVGPAMDKKAFDKGNQLDLEFK